jgi:hypothetical protein
MAWVQSVVWGRVRVLGGVRDHAGVVRRRRRKRTLNVERRTLKDEGKRSIGALVQF